MNKDRKRTLIGSSALFIVFGLAFIIWPEEAKNAICLAAGIVVAVCGLKKLVGTVKEKTFLSPDGKSGVSFVLLLAGVLCAVRYTFLAAVILPLLGAGLFGDGFFKLRLGLEQKKLLLPQWMRNVIISGAIMAVALFILFFNGWEKEAWTIAVGAVFVLNGIYGGWLCFETKEPEALPEPTNN